MTKLEQAELELITRRVVTVYPAEYMKRTEGEPMTKLEQVARAICDYWMEHGFDPSEPSEGAARAAVEELREPSEGSALLWGAFDKTGCTGDEPLEFNAVLDAILNEKPER